MSDLKQMNRRAYNQGYADGLRAAKGESEEHSPDEREKERDPIPYNWLLMMVVLLGLACAIWFAVWVIQ